MRLLPYSALSLSLCTRPSCLSQSPEENDDKRRMKRAKGEKYSKKKKKQLKRNVKIASRR
jgi:hypothetical protein